MIQAKFMSLRGNKMDLEKFKAFIKKYPFIAYAVLGFVFLGLWSVFMATPQNQKPLKPALNKNTKDIGFTINGVDQQAYVSRLEKNYYDFEDRVKAMEDQVKAVKTIGEDIKKQQKEMAKTVLKLDQNLMAKMEDRLNQFQNQAGLKADTGQDNSTFELAVADIKPLQKPESDNSVYLPLGSFCKGTLLTGVYAAADANNPLPVLIALDEAFYGPNQTRIPLKGAFVLGKAVGDLVSERALIQIVAISSVLPNGHTFEQQEDLGYVTDEAGELGIRGQIIRNTGKALALSFMGGFMAGGSQALADDEVTSSRNRFGGVTREVTGDPGKNAVFSGLAKSAGRMSEYYEKQAENLVPAVHVHNGVVVYFIVQKGVTIDGLPRDRFARIVRMD